MSTRKGIALVFLWALSLIVVGAFAHAQTVQPGTTPKIVSGNDFGFRVEGRRGDHVTGTFVVRIDGKWVVAEAAEDLFPIVHAR